MKLTKRLKGTLIMMDSGWKLKRSHDGSWWMQNKGLETIWIHGRTNVHLLLKEGLIASDGYGFPTEKYHLTDKGKEFVNDNH